MGDELCLHRNAHLVQAVIYIVEVHMAGLTQLRGCHGGVADYMSKGAWLGGGMAEGRYPATESEPNKKAHGCCNTVITVAYRAWACSASNLSISSSFSSGGFGLRQRLNEKQGEYHGICTICKKNTYVHAIYCW